MPFLNIYNFEFGEFSVADDGAISVALSYIFNRLFAAIKIQRSRCRRMPISNA